MTSCPTESADHPDAARLPDDPAAVSALQRPHCAAALTGTAIGVWREIVTVRAMVAPEVAPTVRAGLLLATAVRLASTAHQLGRAGMRRTLETPAQRDHREAQAQYPGVRDGVLLAVQVSAAAVAAHQFGGRAAAVRRIVLDLGQAGWGWWLRSRTPTHATIVRRLEQSVSAPQRPDPG